MHQTIVKNLCCADDDHVILEKFFPCRAAPRIAPHSATKALYWMRQIAFKDIKLLEYQCHTIHLRQSVTIAIRGYDYSHQKESNSWPCPLCTMLNFEFKDVLKQQDRYKRLS